MNKYETASSAYAKKEGVYVPSTKVNFRNGLNIASLILRDFKRGWTYNSSGQRIPMNKYLFYHRLFYLIALCRKHTKNPSECRKLKNTVNYIYRHLKLPPGSVVALAGRNARKVARWLTSHDLVSIVRVVNPLKTISRLRTHIPIKHRSRKRVRVRVLA